MLALQVMGGIKKIDMNFRRQVVRCIFGDNAMTVKSTDIEIDFMNETDLYFKCNVVSR